MPAPITNKNKCCAAVPASNLRLGPAILAFRFDADRPFRAAAASNRSIIIRILMPITPTGTSNHHQKRCQPATSDPPHITTTSNATALPLHNRVAGEYSGRRAVCPARGISLPVSTGAARATRPVWARFFMVGRVVSTLGCAAPVGGKANHGASGHQRVHTLRGPLRELAPGKVGRFLLEIVP